ncbi:C40 family peptidase [Corynebacterium sp. HS2168-gen11]|uniref:C40 family peptidase n=1 Tax=Corynebacterium sp. HS2168-gen11 TaxID=2974027 RepID=UPI00216ACD0E|nr:C40 family peptidase [Corynebacterium sp. HS2168-gen11]MCS4536169.1 C40 family peptidase [Corynebacterium sp. HS2168-gen11]
MAKHRRQSQSKARTTAVLGAVAAASTVVPQAAQAAQVVVPGTTFAVDVPGIENVRELTYVPGIQTWIPAVTTQSLPNVSLPAVPDLQKLVPVLTGQANTAAAYSAVVEPVIEQQIPVQTEGNAIVAAARTKIGAPYAWGAKGPYAFDCSGFVTWAYEQVGKQIPRTSYAQAAQGQRVAYQDLRPGDIVVFYSGATHVGIYSGNGMVIHASDYGVPLSEVPMSRMPFHSAVRF